MSEYKTILVHYDAGRTAPARLEIALEIGAQFDAHVACLYALSTMRAPAYSYEAERVVREAQLRASAQMLEAARRSYDECLRRSGYQKVEWQATQA